MKKILISIVSSIAILGVFAAETSNVNYSQGTTSGLMQLVWEYDLDPSGSYAIITGVKNNNAENPVGDITVPYQIIDAADTGYVVKEIADETFINQIGITSISIPYTIQKIGNRVFVGCSVLNSITTDSDNPWFKSYNGMLFDKDKDILIACPATTELITFPSTMTTIGANAFDGCFRLKTITLPAGVTAIGDYAFKGCNKLQSITFTGNQPAIVGTNPFPGANPISIYIPNDNETWPSPGIWHGQNLHYSTGGEASGFFAYNAGNVTWSFRIVDGHAELYNNGEPCIGTGIYQTYTYDEITSIWIPDGELRIPETLMGYPVTRIGDYAFKNCHALTKIKIPSTITSIGRHPFEGSSLTTLPLPESLRQLDSNPMTGCDTILTVTIAGDNSYFTILNGLLYDKDAKILIGCAPRQEAASIAISCEVIGEEAFYGCFRTSTLNIPENVATIDELAFNYMPRLQSLVFPPSLTTMNGAGLFAGCANLSFIGFSGDAPTVDNDLLLGTPNDINIFVSQDTKGWSGDPESSALPSSGKWPTDNANGRKISNLDVSADADLKEGDIFTIISTNGTIYVWTMKVLANKGLELLTISPKPNGSFAVPSEFKSVLGIMTVKSIGQRLFANSTGLLSVTIPDAVTNISSEAFLNCDVLQNVSLNNGLRSIGSHAFSGTSIETITLPDTVKLIDGNILAGCDPSTSISISTVNPYFSVSKEGALFDKDYTTLFAVPMNCETLEIPDTTTSFHEECFLGCIRLKMITFFGDAPNAPDDDNTFIDCHNDLVLEIPAGNTTYGAVPGTWHLRPIHGTGEDSTVGIRTDVNGWSYIVNNGVAELYNNGKCALKGGENAVTVALPTTVDGYLVKSIGEGALANCRGITSISIPVTYEKICANAFSNCTSLSSLNISTGITEIEGNPVPDCSQLTDITVDSGNLYFSAADGALYDRKQEKLIACPASTDETFKIPASVNTIGDSALKNLSHETMIITPETSATYWLSPYQGHEIAIIRNNGCLYSADGTDFIRVADGLVLNYNMIDVSHGEMITTTRIPALNEDGTDGTIVRTTISPATVYIHNENGDISFEDLMTGVTRIRSGAFRGCNNFQPEINAITNSVGEVGFTDEGFGVYAKETKTAEIHEIVYRTIVTIPANVTVEPGAFDGSGIEIAGNTSSTAPISYVTPSPSAQDGDLALAAKTSYAGWIEVDGEPVGIVTLKTNAKSVPKGTITILGEKKKSITKSEQLDDYDEIVLGNAYNGLKGAKWTIALGTIDNGGDKMLDGYTLLSINIQAQGKAKISGYAPDGTKITATSQLVEIDGYIYLPITVQLYNKKGGFSALFKVVNGKPEAITISRFIGKNATATIGIAAIGTPTDSITIGHPICILPDGYVADPTYKMWKPRYTSRTGILTGKFKALGKSKAGKTVKVLGLSIDGTVYATSVITKIASTPTAFEE